MENNRVLEGKEQREAFFLSLGICIEILLAPCLTYWLIVYIKDFPNQDIFWHYLLVAGAGGYLGGSTRSLLKLIIELNNNETDPAYYLSRWFLYLVKPFVGIGAGIAFFVAVNMGLVKVLTGDSAGFYLYGIILSSFTGGMFFENVFALLLGMFKDNTKPIFNQKAKKTD